MFPSDLLEWAGHRSGGVRRLFQSDSGRPTRAIIETPLLTRLRQWATNVASNTPNTPRIILLVGGPGNGKTDAVETTILQLESSLCLGTTLQDTLRPKFNPQDGTTAPRTVTTDVSRDENPFKLTIVQDATVQDSTRPTLTRGALLLEELHAVRNSEDELLYVACINRGILDEALIHATDARDTSDLLQLMQATVTAVGTSPGAPACWPLEADPTVAVWPMDTESLVAPCQQEPLTSSVGDCLLEIATDPTQWPPSESCAAGAMCPFCRNRALLSGTENKAALLKILRWYELATGKKWSFRDLFSLVSYIFAGSPADDNKGNYTPCEWAAKQIDLNQKTTSRPDPRRLAIPFQLLSCQYQHTLFGRHNYNFGRRLRSDLRDLGLEADPTFLGFQYYLSNPITSSLPSTLRPQLRDLSSLLDPSLADPGSEISLSGRTKKLLRDIDSIFSRSVRDAFELLRDHRSLTPLEIDALKRLAYCDDELDKPQVRRKKPTTAVRLQALIRDFSCRLARRSLGTKQGVVRDHDTLVEFERLALGGDQQLHITAKELEALLNDRERFMVPLNSTFGQAPPSPSRKVILATSKQRVKPAQLKTENRPQSDVRFLTIGTGPSQEWIPLTYELYKSIRQLRHGLLSASLPQSVRTRLDTTQAKLAGKLVRDEDQLDGAEISIGSRPEIITVELGQFIIRRGTQP